ncbi:hypothetical protein DCAR_0311785 [Daucus carota subsp. sativus]|uniref:Uncharacterized protein n=1 Tax=Daucus carota subsp. sativus TaxID=79200 RepID=A0A166API7_DAUCS|nr:hypothetical protein DCAR_0311785 [Daucus carota subsp. sativus]
MISGVSQSGISSANGTMMPTPGMGQQGQYLNFFTVLVLASAPKPLFGLAGIMWVAFAESKQKLPQFPLPTHNVVVRGHSPLEFEEHPSYGTALSSVIEGKNEEMSNT